MEEVVEVVEVVGVLDVVQDGSVLIYLNYAMRKKRNSLQSLSIGFPNIHHKDHQIEISEI